MYNVVYPREWEAGLAQRRIEGLIRMIPELREGHTVHVDVFIAQRDGGKPISPWHAKPENGGWTPEKYVETQRKIFKYWRGVKSVDLYRITLDGCVPMKKRGLVTNAKLVLSLRKDEAVSVVPAGTQVSAKK